MSEKFIKIVGFGLIGDGKRKGPFRELLFEDFELNIKTEFILYEKERPSMWSDVVKLEQGKEIPPYRGYITRYNTIDVVVLGNDTVESSYEKQKWKLQIKRRLTLPEAQEMRKETKGYITNLTYDGSYEISWRAIEDNVSIVKFRLYEGNGVFSWTNWFEITEN